MNEKQRILVLGVSGMLGHVLFKKLSGKPDCDVTGTARSGGLQPFFSADELSRIHTGVEAGTLEPMLSLLSDFRPHVVVNCVGIVKQLPEADDPLVSLAINAALPHRLALACRAVNSRLVHLSTDCVYSGGLDRPYKESDPPDPGDLYGRTKLLGEVEEGHCITLRTSMIGHALKGNLGLVDWFLSQSGTVRGYTNVLFSGLTTIELSRVILEQVLPAPKLSGVYHLSAPAINKHELLNLVARQYGRSTRIDPYGDVKVNRALDSSRFTEATGYRAPDWGTLIADMHAHHEANAFYRKTSG